jgi:hypothetical protein
MDVLAALGLTVLGFRLLCKYELSICFKHEREYRLCGYKSYDQKEALIARTAAFIRKILRSLEY